MVSSQDPVGPDPGGVPWPPPASDEAAVACRYRFADVEFDEAEGQLRVAGKPIVVEPRPLRLLAELLRHAGEVVTKEELLDSVWEGRPTVDHVLANAVSKLRTALGEQGAARLSTVPRVGYKLAGPVQRLAARAPEVLLQAGQPVPGREGYVLERALGQGGNSDVWLARHAKLGQTHVFKFAADGPRLSALKREYTLCRVLAQELGPRDDFVRLIDTNFSAAPYFIECAFGGQSLLEWGEAGGRLAGLPTQARLDLFVQIGRAVAAAHSVGVLHKDIKPGNVLVQAATADATDNPSKSEWQARLTDFGSGRLLDPARLDGLQLTAQGLTQTVPASSDSRSGTLMYMAPELMTGQPPTVQSDVYALGMLLWQLLVGDLRRPMVTGWQRELSDELLVADLTAATEGRPAERLQSAAELVDRVIQLPVRRAARDAALESEKSAQEVASQLQKARARRPWVLGAVVSLALGLLGSVAFGVQLRAALQRSEQQTQRADVINDFMRDDLLGGVGVTGVGADGLISLRALVDRASVRAQQRFVGQPQTEAVVRAELGGLYIAVSQFASAEREYRSALARLEPLAPRTDPLWLKTRFDLARALGLGDKLKDAKAMLDAAEKDAGSSLAGQDRLAFSAANARMTVLMQIGRTEGALAATERMVEIADRLDNADPALRFTSRAALADVLYRLSQYDKALTTIEVAAAPPFDAQAVGGVNLARAKVTRGRVLVALGRLDEAETDLMAARDELSRRMGPGDNYVGWANGELGGIYGKRGDFDRALASYRAAHDGYAAGLGADHPSSRVMALNIVMTELNKGATAAGLARLDEARVWWVKLVGGTQVPVIQIIDFERARALTQLGRPAEALAILEALKPEALAEAEPARDWAWRLPAERGRALLRAGRRADGLALLLPALQPMAENGTPAWLLSGYRALARDKAPSTP
jgi:non-specific serine/threonine protein kinase